MDEDEDEDEDEELEEEGEEKRSSDGTRQTLDTRLPQESRESEGKHRSSSPSSSSPPFRYPSSSRSNAEGSQGWTAR